MKKIIVLLILTNMSIACTTQYPNSKSSSIVNLNIPPDLTKVTYAGGDGKTVENAIIIKNAENERNGVAAEYAYISKINGVKFNLNYALGIKNCRQMLNLQ